MPKAKEESNIDVVSKNNGPNPLKVLGRNGVYSILLSLHDEPLGFSQLMFKTQLNPAILDRHLKALMELNLIDKNKKYNLTPKGERVLTLLNELLKTVR
ncbi:ArsR family transcriptional regulator [Archaeoglobus veneficus]|uniref:Regulatory protein ArsR n=1 Tax=Archaeoglobus veneficus (strain DSM 11195 / SNP6) TaxID=693661 RepID=F2KPE8_ARCVS|nr:ArsR family transcriptional regulator [Archaeoglobus veneficus]AEA46379.1 regulatory protein ArsR [Archaeoglobus veneficus SNP6]